VPCEDIDIIDNEDKTNISQSIGDDYQHLDSDLCSPFCNCHCCHIHATHEMTGDFSVKSTEIFTIVFFYGLGHVKDFNTSILQPPQV
jgi:hypothetical protein